VKVVLCHGIFDLLHMGHIVHLRGARKFGDWVVVSVVADKYVTKTTLVYDQVERLALLAAVRYVDEVILCEAPTPEMVIEKLRPDVYVRGSDYIGKRMPEDGILGQLWIPVRHTESIPIHTSDIIERIRNVVTSE
jgi:cytidyltransferase-like protein